MADSFSLYSQKIRDAIEAKRASMLVGQVPHPVCREYHRQPAAFGTQVRFGQEVFGVKPDHESCGAFGHRPTCPHSSPMHDMAYGLLARDLFESRQRELELKAQVEEAARLLSDLRKCYADCKQELTAILNENDWLKITRKEWCVRIVSPCDCPNCIDDAENTTLGRETDSDDGKKPLDAATDTEKVTDTSQTVPDVQSEALLP